VRPESFTHGSAEQRQYWFERGFNNPTLESCNTFAA
jgi:predicted metalloprotease